MHETEGAGDPSGDRLDGADSGVDYPVRVGIRAETESRNRLTAAFRFFLALPHLILVGGPVGMILSVDWSTENGGSIGYGSGGMIGAVVVIGVFFAWLAILLAGRYPDALWRFSTWYLRWRLRAIAYVTLLRDEYPPFGDGDYPTTLEVTRPERRRLLTVAFRIFYLIPHLVALWFLSIAWAFSTAVAWAAILLTGRYPEPLYGFALGVLAWGMRVEAYTLLLRDEYPPFSLRV